MEDSCVGLWSNEQNCWFRKWPVTEWSDFSSTKAHRTHRNPSLCLAAQRSLYTSFRHKGKQKQFLAAWWVYRWVRAQQVFLWRQESKFYLNQWLTWIHRGLFHSLPLLKNFYFIIPTTLYPKSVSPESVDTFRIKTSCLRASKFFCPISLSAWSVNPWISSWAYKGVRKPIYKPTTHKIIIFFPRNLYKIYLDTFIILRN